MLRFADRRFIHSFLAGAAYLAIALVIQSYAVAFATGSASNSVTDIVLSNTPTLPVDGYFIYGTVLAAACALVASLVYLRRAPFVLKSGALFFFIRSFFVSLTHINTFPTQVAITPNAITRLFPFVFTGKDLFFSGHAGAPFLMALIFWDKPALRYLFLGFSIAFAFVVLFGHLHYSIDVAAAYFITYSIFALAKYLFASDFARAHS
ncbi:MAG: hypothetical protein KGI78_03880 [Patescibacteria group bacterium]|nr:hypothetical protein [Patescibacteria group bacterium]MDE1944130.1 hypothetical protein [Patescibacteria group bacterium]MDE1944751.1 hypothetical protein [Patescibacteria group bacterium]MDE2057963.1 hypothetical protein [Patescibacteria group bacterium]